jgi:hypothetical protein
MATLTIGNQSITVDDSFRNLSPADQQKTVDEIAASLNVQGSNSPSTPPAGAVPGDQAYKDWAIAQAKAGRPLPMVSKTTPTLTDPLSQISAGTAAAANSVPIAGPMLLSGLERGRAAVQTALGHPMTQQGVASETQQLQNANPVATTIGGVTGATLPFMLAPALPLVGGLSARALGMVGSLPARMALGGLSGAAIGGADSAVRGGDTRDVVTNAALGGVLGGALPAVERGVSGVLSRVTGQAIPKEAQNLARAMRDDKIDPTTVNQQLSALGPDSMVMDLGPNLQRQAGAVASIPGAGQTAIRDAVAARGANASARVTNDVAQTIGQAPDLDTLKAQIVANQKAAADPLYAAVRDKPVPIQGNLKFVQQTPMGKAAFHDALNSAKNDGYGYQNGPTVGLMDYWKQNLDDMATTYARRGMNNKARQAGNLARLVRTSTDKVAPGYAAARDAFAGHAQVHDAVDNGTTAFTKDTTPTQLANQLRAMSPSERDAYLQGARSYVESQMGNAVNDALSLRNMFKRNYNEQKLRLILGDGPANDLMARINREAVFGKTANVVSGNSETASRQAAQAEVAPELGRAPRPHSVTTLGLVLSAFDNARAKLHGYNQPRINANMADMLASGRLNPAQINQITRGSLPQIPGALARATPGIAQYARQPVYITVNGGN